MHVSAQHTASGLAWVPRHEDARATLAMAQTHGMSELLAGMLIGRGVTVDDASAFLNPTLRDYLPDPFHLKDMARAVARLLRAIERRERITVFGDYDVDGATSTALLHAYFRALGVPLAYYIPDRLKEGYGPTEAAFAAIIDAGAQLIITVDCGTLSHAPIAYAQARGVDVIVLDHHLSSGALPPAHAVVNPNRVDETSPCRQLAAVGVVFLVLVALNKKIKESGIGDGGLGIEKNSPPSTLNLLNVLDLVALGTVCDVMPLTGLNRALVTQGLKIIKNRSHTGLAALADCARLQESPTVYHLGFLLGPRINAGGRVGESTLGVRLLTTDQQQERSELAARLEQLNAERQAIEAGITEQALALAQRQLNAPVIVVAQEGWHAGVIGIVAARLKEQFSRPAAVIALEQGVGKGSARSVMGADMGAAIHAAHTQGIITAGGGHAMAAGFTVAAEHVDTLHAFLCQRLEHAVAEYNEARVRKLDGWVSVGAANLALIEEMSAAGPFGIGNPSPRLGIKSARIAHRDVMKDKHIRLNLVDDRGSGTLQAVAFSAVGTKLGDWLLNEKILHLAGELKLNSWQGRVRPQFTIEDAAKAG